MKYSRKLILVPEDCVEVADQLTDLDNSRNNSDKGFTREGKDEPVEVEHLSHLTKISVLSTITRFLCVLGLLGPVINKAELFIQQLWLMKIDWSEKRRSPSLASEKTHGATVYARSCTSDVKIKVKHSACKSHVSPLKQITIPRLELCVAVLLVKLMHNVKDALKMDFDSVDLWSDSTIGIPRIHRETRE
ncbi:reverse transcriptase [Caerostris darwini]|uniref:Reverse transcriptase n=1 Tax=Caerostris darwini TaxID=1538125 RepID=A0AAV4QPM9_9ARAC|nr:reverse transcriptase [Caerostris darwini]